jgi:hypothetical protein
MAIEGESANIEHVSEEDVEIAVDRLLREAHVTFDELRQQNQSGQFSSEEARLAAWVIFGFAQ